MEMRPQPGGKFALYTYRPGQRRPASGRLVGTVAGVNIDQRTWDSVSTRPTDATPVWTDTYVFFDEKGELTYPGVTCSAPVRRPDGSLLGVVGVDIDVFALCDFLKGLNVSDHGYAFVVEQRPPMARAELIAHPDQQVLLDEVKGPGEGQQRRLVNMDSLTDRPCRPFCVRCRATWTLTVCAA